MVTPGCPLPDNHKTEIVLKTKPEPCGSTAVGEAEEARAWEEKSFVKEYDTKK